jgi:ATP-binding cassette subfamily B (MDR/TAP) protein 1
MDNLKTQIFSFMILGAVGFVTLAAQAALFERAADLATRDFKIQWFHALLRQDMAYFDIKDVSAQATIVSANAIRFKRGVGRKMGEAIQFTCNIIGGFIYAFYVSWKVSLVILAVVPLMAAAGFFLLKVTLTQNARSNRNYAEAASVVYSSLSSIKTVQAINAVPIMLTKFTNATAKAYKAGASFVLWVGFGNGLVFSSFLVSYIALTLYGAYLLYSAVQTSGCDPSGGHNGNVSCPVTGADVFGASFGISFAGMTLPQVSAAIEALTGAREACYPALEAIQRTSSPHTPAKNPDPNHVQDTTPDIEAATDTVLPEANPQTTTATTRRDIPLPTYVIDSSSELGLKPNSISGDIVFHNVSFSYPTRPGIWALHNLSLSIQPNTTVALVGASGSGKSTVIQLLERFYDPTTGNITLDGCDLKSFNVQWLREQIGLVSQEPTLFARSIRENIAYGRPHVTQEEIEEAAKIANAHEFITSFPQGYDTNVGDKGAQLSGSSNFHFLFT